MKECKALIFPSIWYEVLPYVIIEAFSTGTPVLASNTGSMSSHLLLMALMAFIFYRAAAKKLKRLLQGFILFLTKKYSMKMHGLIF
jgi:glycosyltransferase involved in cell wall biosynthesis